MSRFLYIDSKGKEVPIPSVDALALRVELGAVKEDTQFYDSAADRWAPAGEHEVFRSLQREAQEKSAGFVAPPPPPLPPPPVRQAPPPPPPAAKPPAPNPFEAIEGPAPAGQGSHDVFGGMDLGLTLDDSAITAHEQAAVDRAQPAKKREEASSFDFQDFGGGLVEDDGEDEGDAATPTAPGPAPAQDGLQLEDALAASYDLSGSGQRGVSAEKIETDAPLSEQAAPSSDWSRRLEMVDQNADAVTSAPRRGGRGGGGGADRPPRARPAAAPQRESSGFPMGLVAGVVLLLLGGGGFLGWRAMRGGEEVVVQEEVDPAVTIPNLPQELEPRMRQVAQLALADWVVAVRDSLPVQRAIAVEPDAAWLSGQYMAGANQFGSVAQYWRDLSGYVDGVLDDEQRIYESFLDAHLVDSLGAPDANAAVLRERAAAGFQAARPDRRVVYRQLRTVIEAATGLHDFLVENEDRIEYQPGPERDPVLEAVPENTELGDQMWGRVDDITAALDGLGAIDKVTTQRLMELATDKFQEIGIR